MKKGLAVTQTGLKLTNFPHATCSHTLLIVLTPEGQKSERSQALGKIKVQSCTLEVLEEHPCSAHLLVSLLQSCAGEWSRLLPELPPPASRGLDVCSPLPLAWQWQPSQTVLRVPHSLHQCSIGDEGERLFGSHNVAYHNFHLKRTKIHEQVI